MAVGIPSLIPAFEWSGVEEGHWGPPSPPPQASVCPSLSAGLCCYFFLFSPNFFPFITCWSSTHCFSDTPISVTQKLCCAKETSHIHEHGRRWRRGRQLFYGFTGPDLMYVGVEVLHPKPRCSAPSPWRVNLMFLMWK